MVCVFVVYVCVVWLGTRTYMYITGKQHRHVTGALNVMRSQGQCTMKKDNQSETCLVTGLKYCSVELLMIRSVYGEQVCVS